MQIVQLGKQYLNFRKLREIIKKKSFLLYNAFLHLQKFSFYEEPLPCKYSYKIFTTLFFQCYVASPFIYWFMELFWNSLAKVTGSISLPVFFFFDFC